jgi:uncharacterized RDD family membrane protein YckC
MTHDIAGTGDAGPMGDPAQPEARKPRRRALLPTTLLNLSVVAGLTVAVMLFAGSIPSTAVLVLYLVAVLSATLLWNFEQGIIAAFIGALAAEFFYFEPRLSLNAGQRYGVMAVLIFLAAALLSGYLVDQIRRLRRAAPVLAAASDPDTQSVLPDQPVLRLGGTTRTVPERIAEFLVGHECAMYCDQCIQDELGLKWRQQVQLVTATLAVTNLFQRDFGQCQTCKQFKQVIRHVKPH